MTPAPTPLSRKRETPTGGTLAGPRLTRAAALRGFAALCLAGVAACGKKGPPDPPGPANEINYPKQYPTY